MQGKGVRKRGTWSQHQKNWMILPEVPSCRKYQHVAWHGEPDTCICSTSIAGSGTAPVWTGQPMTTSTTALGAMAFVLLRVETCLLLASCWLFVGCQCGLQQLEKAKTYDALLHLVFSQMISG